MQPPITSTHPLTPPPLPFTSSASANRINSIEHRVTPTYGPIKIWFYFLLLSGRHICHASRHDFKCERAPGKMCHHVGSAHPPERISPSLMLALAASLRPCRSPVFGAKLQLRFFGINTVHLHFNHAERLLFYARDVITRGDIDGFLGENPFVLVCIKFAAGLSIKNLNSYQK